MLCPVTGQELAAMAADVVGKDERTRAEAQTK